MMFEKLCRLNPLYIHPPKDAPHWYKRQCRYYRLQIRKAIRKALQDD